MEINLPTDQQALIENLVASGRFSSASEVIAAGVQLLAASERLRQDIQVGMEQADRGELTDHETVFTRLKVLTASASSSSDSDGPATQSQRNRYSI